MSPLLLIFISGLTLNSAWANPDEALPPQGEPGEKVSSPTRKAMRKSGINSIKDADGTAAPNRFEAETVIKSSYTLDGKPLEVDPD